MLSNDEVYIGTELKFRIEIGSSGFNMMDDDFMVDIYRGPNALHFKKEDLEMDELNNFYVCFDTLALGTGKVSAKITAFVPDSDYPDNLRTEVAKIDLINIKA